MNDIEEIRRAINAYARNIDERTPEKFATEVFAPDANVDVGFGLLEGVDQIIRAYKAEIEHFEATAHVISNIEVEVSGDTARSTAYVTFWHWPKGPASANPPRETDDSNMGVYLGVYVDQLARGSEGWRIAHRRFRKLGPETEVPAG